MRLAARAKRGPCPASAGAIAGRVGHPRVRPPDPEEKPDTINILGPCCGKGAAIGRIAAALPVPEAHVYAAERDEARSEDARAPMPRRHRLGPASSLGVPFTGSNCGLVNLDPPFDDEPGGGRREERDFAEQAARLLVSEGILALGCPLKALACNRSSCQLLDASYDELTIEILSLGHGARAPDTAVSLDVFPDVFVFLVVVIAGDAAGQPTAMHPARGTIASFFKSSSGGRRPVATRPATP